MKDPYQVLGVSRDASDEEIKDAYRALVKKYHPDKFSDSDLAELANEKMKEVNSAYDEIQKMRSGKGTGNNSYGDFHTSEDSSSEFYGKVRRFINMNNVFEAEQMLRSVPNNERGAEWNFLYACLMVKKGYYADAQRYFDIACNMDPQNAEYSATREQFRARGAQYQRGYNTQSSASTCDCCTSLLCADCCCECMGGDLISCC